MGVRNTVAFANNSIMFNTEHRTRGVGSARQPVVAPVAQWSNLLRCLQRTYHDCGCRLWLCGGRVV
jgi:hypothetical protein